LPAAARPEAAKQKSKLREFLEQVAAAVLTAAFIMYFVARAFQVDGTSMLPTLAEGERLLVEKVTYRLREPARGEIVVFRFPQDPRQHFIKRVIGLPGDEVYISGGWLFINGEPIEEDYILARMRGSFGPVEVPKGHYFVLGDNRNISEDSRSPQVGMVPFHLFEGRAVFRFWPFSRAGLMRAPPLAFAAE